MNKYDMEEFIDMAKAIKAGLRYDKTKRILDRLEACATSIIEKTANGRGEKTKLKEYLMEELTKVHNDAIVDRRSEHKIFMAYLWGGEKVIVSARSHQEAVEFLMEKGYHGGMGPMDFGERVWEMPDGRPEEKMGPYVVCVAQPNEV
jgi:hypothetical protein